MKLLFDENLSPRLVDLLAADFPGCTHIERAFDLDPGESLLILEAAALA